MIGHVICAAVVVLFYFAFDLIYPPRGLLLRDWIQGIDRVAAWIPPLWPLPITRCGKLNALRTMELWAWWSRLRRDCRPDSYAEGYFSRPALKMTYTISPSKPEAYIFLDKFDRRQVEWFYAGNVGGYTREEVAEMIKRALSDTL